MSTSSDSPSMSIEDLAANLARAAAAFGQSAGSSASGSGGLSAGSLRGGTQPSFSMQELASDLARSYLAYAEDGGGGGGSSCTTQSGTVAPLAGGLSAAGSRSLEDVLRDAHRKVQQALEQERGGQDSNQPPGP
jgi:hypothetical protein